MNFFSVAPLLNFVLFAVSVAIGGWYIKSSDRRGEIPFLFAWSVTLGLFWAQVFFPGNMTPDSFDSWNQAIRGDYFDQHPVIYALLMRVSIGLFGENIAFFTVLQACAFYLSSFVLIREVIGLGRNKGRSRFFLTCVALFSVIPILWLYSTIIWKDVLICIFANFMTAAFIRYAESVKPRHIYLALFFLALTVLARKNAITIVIGVVGILFLMRKKIALSKVRLAFVAGAIGAIFFVSSAVNKAFKVHPAHHEAFTFAYSLLGFDHRLLKRTGEFDQPSKIFWDQVVAGSEGYERLVKREEICGDEWRFIFDSSIDWKNLNPAVDAMPNGLLPLLADFGLRHPLIVAEQQACVLSRLLLRGENYDFSGVQANQLGIEFAPRWPSFYDTIMSVIRLTRKTPLRVPLVFVCFQSAIVFFAFRARKHGPGEFEDKWGISPMAAIVPSLVGLSYFLGYCLFPNVDWRYLLLVFVLSWATLIPMAVVVFNRQRKIGFREWVVKGKRAGEL